MADQKNESSPGSSTIGNEAVHSEKRASVGGYGAAPDAVPRDKLNAMFENPLGGIPREQLFADVDKFCTENNLIEYQETFRKGALVAQDPSGYQHLDVLSDDEKRVLEEEHTHKWRHPKQLYYLVIMCSLCAAVQGMDETVNNGAQTFYLKRFNVVTDSKTNTSDRFDVNMANYITGLVVGAPYLACAVLGCWLTAPLNSLFGRRGTIFISCLIAALASIWEGVANSWVNLFVARFFLGLGIGSKSTTTPVYAAECSPPLIRGALVMMWQMWTAFGIMLGNIMGVAFLNVGHDLNWRLMLGSTVVLPLVVCAQVYLCPESPRWLIKKNRVDKAFHAFQRIRGSDLQAARDLYYCYVNVEIERKVSRGRNLVKEMFTVGRNRRAALASWIVMFMQQFCGVNVIAYYSTTIFLNSGFSESSALLASMGTGILNWVFAIPAFLTIDSFGRRNLLLFTYPFLAIFLFWTGFSFWIDELKPKRVAMVTTGMYLFEVFYSPGSGPVPFTYSAEAFPLHIREVGMSFATATTWTFNFILSFTWPMLRTSFKDQGAFAWYAVWCLIGWVGVLLFVPETKALTLEELDQVFSVPTWKHASYHIKAAMHTFRVKVLRQKLPPMPKFWQGDENLGKSF
ncbi:MAG: hypothetical protein Q9191_006153, partial [Dirinaria sp. TL-2023a]